MKNKFAPKRILAKSVTFHQSFLASVGDWSYVLPVALAVAPDRSQWVAATDLKIGPCIMKRILKYPGPAHFWYAHRIWVNLQVVASVSPDRTLAWRARQLAANCLCLAHPINFPN